MVQGENQLPEVVLRLPAFHILPWYMHVPHPHKYKIIYAGLECLHCSKHAQPFPSHSYIINNAAQELSAQHLLEVTEMI